MLWITRLIDFKIVMMKLRYKSPKETLQSSHGHAWHTLKQSKRNLQSIAGQLYLKTRLHLSCRFTGNDFVSKIKHYRISLSLPHQYHRRSSKDCVSLADVWRFEEAGRVPTFYVTRFTNAWKPRYIELYKLIIKASSCNFPSFHVKYTCDIIHI